MRLIDADALRDRCLANAEGWFCHREITMAEAMKMICEMIDDAPTIEAEPVRHSRWVAIDRIASGFPWKLRCNRCGVPQDFPHTYCPNCGAKMDGGAE